MMSTYRCRELLWFLILISGLLCLGVDAASDNQKLLNRTIERVRVLYLSFRVLGNEAVRVPLTDWNKCDTWDWEFRLGVFIRGYYSFHNCFTPILANVEDPFD